MKFTKYFQITGKKKIQSVKHFIQLYKMLNGKLEGAETYCNDFTGFTLKVSTIK